MFKVLAHNTVIGSAGQKRKINFTKCTSKLQYFYSNSHVLSCRQNARSNKLVMWLGILVIISINFPTSDDCENAMCTP